MKKKQLFFSFIALFLLAMYFTSCEKDESGLTETGLKLEKAYTVTLDFTDGITITDTTTGKSYLCTGWIVYDSETWEIVHCDFTVTDLETGETVHHQQMFMIRNKYLFNDVHSSNILTDTELKLISNI